MSDLNKNQKTKASGHGGARPGAGRPKGSGNKVRLEDLMMSIEGAAGMPFTERLAINYINAIEREDFRTVTDYDKAILNKIVADQNHIEVDETTSIENRQASFLKALEVIGGIAQPSDNGKTDD